MTRGAASLTAPGRRMGEVETIFALLGVVYMAECCLATDKNALIFSPAPFAQRLRKGITITLRSALVFLNPIPPFTTASVCHPAPVSLSPKGVVLYNSLTHDLARLRPPGHNFIAYGDIARLEYDKEGRLHINDLEFPCGGEEQARQLASDIGRLSILSKSTLYAGAALDKAMEDELRAMFSPRLDAAAIIARRREVRWRSLPAICAATLLCVQLFAVAPTVMILSSAHKIWLIAALVLLGLHCLTVLCFWLGHRRLYPAAGEERLKRLLTMLCNPFAAMSWWASPCCGGGRAASLCTGPGPDSSTTPFPIMATPLPTMNCPRTTTCSGLKRRGTWPAWAWRRKNCNCGRPWTPRRRPTAPSV